MRRCNSSVQIEHLSGGNSMSRIGYEIITTDVHSHYPILLCYRFVTFP